jgi:hypothetical protein
MKKIFTCLIITLFTSIAISQNAVEKTGPLIDNKAAEFFDDIITQNESCLYMIRKNTEGKGINYFLERYNATDLNKAYSYPVLKLKDYEVQSSKPFIKDNKFYILSKQHHTESKTAEYILNIYNASSGQEIKKDILLETATDLATWYTHSMIYKLNADTTKIIFIFNKSTGKENKNTMTLVEYDLSSYKKIGERKIDYDNTNKYDYTNYKLDNENNICFFHYYNYDYKLARYTTLEFNSYNIDPSKVPVKYKIDIPENNSLGNIDYTFESSNKSIYIYASINENRPERSDRSFKNSGLYVLKLDAGSLKKIRNTVSYFSKDIVNKLTSYKENPVALPESNYIPFFHFFDNENVFIGLSNQWGTDDKAEIILHSLNSELNVNWSKYIYRSIRYLSPLEPFGTTKIISGNTLNLLFLENLEFETKKMDINTVDRSFSPPAGNYHRTNAVVCSIDLKGNLTHKILHYNFEKWLIPSNEYFISKNGKMICRFRKGKSEWLGLVNIK